MGSQTVPPYSTIGRTRDLYAWALMLVEEISKFRTLKHDLSVGISFQNTLPQRSLAIGMPKGVTLDRLRKKLDGFLNEKIIDVIESVLFPIRMADIHVGGLSSANDQCAVLTLTKLEGKEKNTSFPRVCVVLF